MVNFRLKISISIMFSIIVLFGWAQKGSIDKLSFTIVPTNCDSSDLQDLKKYSPVKNKLPIIGVDGDAMYFISFPGGDEELIKFVKKNLRYPDKAVKDSLQGKVIAKFNTDKDGKVCKVRIVQSLSLETDNEVIRVISMLPNWIWSEKLKVSRRTELEWTMPFIFRMDKTDLKK